MRLLLLFVLFYRRSIDMSDRLYEFIVTGGCILTIIAGSIFGAWALLQTL